MARYSAFLGRKVEVQYRAGDILLPASGTFVADSGKSVFLEQQFEQKGQYKHFRWEIPYQYLVRIEEKTAEKTNASAAVNSKVAPEPQEAGVEPRMQPTFSRGTQPAPLVSNAAAAGAGAGNTSGSLLGLTGRRPAETT